MESLLKTALIISSLSIFLQAQTLSASVSSKHGKTSCGTYSVSPSDDLGQEKFYVDGRLVDRDFFCRALGESHERHCFWNQYCQLLEQLSRGLGRKSLKSTIREGNSVKGNIDKTSEDDRKETDSNKSMSKPKMLAMAAPVFFLLCCTVICPCFQAKKRDTAHIVLNKDPISIVDSVSMEANPTFEKLPASPMRAPASPLRIPPSPLRVPPSPSRFSLSPQLTRIGSVHLSIHQVAKATHNFSPSLLIGEGGFGLVYKAELPDGQVVAIKRARKFEAASTEFKSEVELLAKIEHRNLVRLLGYVERGNERLIITEYIPNGNLREHLDGLKGNILDFSQRLEISIDIAHGLTYLHLYTEKQIIHRDIKSSNILLTENLRAKVADFGFARLGDDSEKTHVSTKVKGTVGYLDPEYMRTYQLTAKSDVYSFGILLLEILTGRRPVDLKKPPEERITIKWAFAKYRQGRLKELLDPLMKEAIEKRILSKMFDLAMQCVAPTRADRPDMKAVGEELWAIRVEYLISGNGGQ